MTYSVSAYAVDLNQLIGAIGSRDKELAARVKENSAWRIESYDDPTVLGRAIDRLIDGEVDNPGGDVQAHDLAYALECVASLLAGGEIGASNALKSIAGQWLYEQPVLKDLVGGSLGPLEGKIPYPDDFPGIRIIPLEELRARMDAIRGVNKTEDRNLRNAYFDYMQFIETASLDKRSLIIFYY